MVGEGGATSTGVDRRCFRCFGNFSQTAVVYKEVNVCGERLSSLEYGRIYSVEAQNQRVVCCQTKVKVVVCSPTEIYSIYRENNVELYDERWG